MNRDVDRIIEKLGAHNNGIIQSVVALTEMAIVFENDLDSHQVNWCEEKLRDCLRWRRVLPFTLLALRN